MGDPEVGQGLQEGGRCVCTLLPGSGMLLVVIVFWSLLCFPRAFNSPLEGIGICVPMGVHVPLCLHE